MLRETVVKTKILFEKLNSIKYFKYIFVSVIFLLLVSVVDSHSWLARIVPVSEREKLEQQKAELQDKIEKSNKLYNELKSNNENLEKFAREQYFMKKENEEIFLIREQNSEDEKEKKSGS